MRRKNPTVLPGKELSGIHLSVQQANLCPLNILQEEILPLINLAEKKFWIQKGAGESLLKEVCDKNPIAAWRLAKDWHRKINITLPEESSALAGWMLLKNLAACQKIRQSQKKPYSQLIGSIPESLKRLNFALYYNSQGTASERQTSRRDLLAILLLKHSTPSQTEALCLKTFGSTNFTQTTSPPWLKLSHGFYTKSNEWVRIPTQQVDTLLSGLLTHEDIKTKTWLKTLHIL